MIVSTEEGVVYTLRYGGSVFASGEELSAGKADDAEKKDEAARRSAKKPEGTQESRYLMVTVSFDPTADPQAQGPSPKPAITPTDHDRPFQQASPPTDPKHIAEEKEPKEKAKREKADHEKKIADGKKRVEGARRPLRPVVLRHSRRQLPLDRAGPRLALPAQEAARRAPGAGAAGLPGSAAAGAAVADRFPGRQRLPAVHASSSREFPCDVQRP